MVPDSIRYLFAFFIIILSAIFFLVGLWRRRGTFRYDTSINPTENLDVSKGRGLILIYFGIAFFIVGVTFLFVKF